ncbi:MAG: ABC transporter substrate-binding protein [Butyrivibrio sp.]|nr:ABC transporter substrate-binding protein [Butyrivibrio sp.]
MKKILALALTGALTLSIVACGTAVSGNTAAENTAAENTATTQSESNESTADAGKTTEVEVADYSTLSADELDKLYSEEAASKTTIHIGYSGGLCQVALPVAQHYGFFEDEGLTTELTSSEDSRDALAAGKIDTAAGMIAQWLTSVQNGVDIKFTLGLHTGCAAAVVLPDSEYQGFEKGMKIGFVGAFGGVYHNIANRFVAHDGFTEEDFTWLGFDDSAVLLALQDGEVDAIVVSEQLSKNWEKEGKVRQIRSLTTDDDFKDEACCVLGISGKFLEANPVASYKISRAVYNASNWLAESEANRADAAKMLIENGYISGTEEYALELLNYYKFGLTPEVTEKSLYDSVDEYTKLGVLDKNADAEAFKKKIYYAYKF